MNDKHRTKITRLKKLQREEWAAQKAEWAQRRAQVMDWHREGKKDGWIGERLGISKQRVLQIRQRENRHDN